jgi:hypothetical protein
MRTLYRDMDLRDPEAAAAFRLELERTDPDVVILETPNVDTIKELTDCANFWPTLGGWSVLFSGMSIGGATSCVQIASPWRIHDRGARGTNDFSVLCAQIEGPRPGTLRVASRNARLAIEINIQE